MSSFYPSLPHRPLRTTSAYVDRTARRGKCGGTSSNLGSVTSLPWHCVIAAGGAAPEEIAEATGAKTKGAVSLLGTTSLARVLDACRTVGFESIAVVADEETASELALREGERAVPPGEANIQSTLNGLDGLPDHAPTFLTVCDAPLMEAAHIERFLQDVEERRREASYDGRWFAAGLADEPDVRRRYPGVRYRYIRFREGRFASGALYASTPASVRHAAQQLRVGSERRKSVPSLVLQVGLLSLVRYLLGTVSLSEAELRIAGLLGGECFIVTGCDPATTMDFDTLEDLRNVERLLRESKAV